MDGVTEGQSSGTWRGAAKGCSRGVRQRGAAEGWDKDGIFNHLESPSASCMSRFIVFYYCDDFSKVKVKVKV